MKFRLLPPSSLLEGEDDEEQDLVCVSLRLGRKVDVYQTSQPCRMQSDVDSSRWSP